MTKFPITKSVFNCISFLSLHVCIIIWGIRSLQWQWKFSMIDQIIIVQIDLCSVAARRSERVRSNLEARSVLRFRAVLILGCLLEYLDYGYLWSCDKGESSLLSTLHWSTWCVNFLLVNEIVKSYDGSSKDSRRNNRNQIRWPKRWPWRSYSVMNASIIVLSETRLTKYTSMCRQSSLKRIERWRKYSSFRICAAGRKEWILLRIISWLRSWLLTQDLSLCLNFNKMILFRLIYLAIL